LSSFGVYLHIPFCRRRCDYCAFATWTDRASLIPEYLDACASEIARAELRPATSVFVGGGTPSLVDGAALGRLLSAVPVAPGGAEVTVECNPDDASPELFDAWLSAGVTRVSFGVQSMQRHVLASLGRTHDLASVVRATSLAASCGFTSWSVDLIYGGAGETLDDWRSTLASVLSLTAGAPPHVSAYALTVEPGTPLALDVSRHPDDDDQAAKYEVAESMLSGAGLRWYELSNWAVPRHECRHNQLYWAQGDYVGIGCAAHSHVAGRRWWNVRTPDRYISLVRAGASVEAGSETLSGLARRREAVELSLRTRAGVPASVVPDDVVDAGLVDVVSSPGRGVLTVPGRLLANEVAIRLLDP
jgi:oxygen-independent coproporphyrinogen-3 oxidase